MSNIDKPIQQDVVEAVAAMAGCRIGQLPTEPGVVIQLAPGVPRALNIDGSSEDSIGILCLSKNVDDPTAFAPLYDICNSLTLAASYTPPIYDILVRANPSPVGNDGTYRIYSCMLLVRFFNPERR